MEENHRLRELFSNKVGQMAADIEHMIRDMSPQDLGSIPTAASEKIRVIAHSLHGAGTMYGFNCVSELGASMTALLDALQARRIQLTAGIIDLFRAAAELLREIARPGPMPASVTDAISGLAWKYECAVHGTASTNTAASPARAEAPSPTA